jgi:hypothetical protein
MGSVLEESDRLTFVRSMLKLELGVEVGLYKEFTLLVALIDMLQVDRIESLGQHNTFVYCTHLVTSTSTSVTRSKQPGTVPLPTPTPEKVIVRIANPATGDDPKVKTENEVAALALVRENTDKSVLPVADVYAWSSEGWGWMVLEHLPGCLRLWFSTFERGLMVFDLARNVAWARFLGRASDRP